MGLSQQLLIPYAGTIRSPLALDPSLWLRPNASTVYTAGCRTLTSSDKASFVGTGGGVAWGTGNAGLEVWFQWDGSTATAYLYSDGGNGSKGISLLIVNSTTIRLYAEGSATLTLDWTVTALSTGVHHAVVAIDRTAGAAELYLDGATESTTDISSQAGQTFTAALNATVGAYASGATGYFGGSLQCIRCYVGYAPTATDVTALYNSGNPLTYAEVDALGGSLANSVVRAYNCNETVDTANLIDQAGTTDLVLTGGNIIVNGGFTGDISGWTNRTLTPWNTAEYSSDKARLVCDGDSSPTVCNFFQNLTLRAGARYLISFAVTKISGNALYVQILGTDCSGLNGYSYEATANATITNASVTPTTAGASISCASVNSGGITTEWNVDLFVLKATAIAIGSGFAEAIAEDSIGTSDATLTGFSAAQKISAWTTNTPDGSYTITVTDDGSGGTDATMVGFSDVDAARVNDIPTVLEGVITRSLQFDGTDDYCTITGPASTDTFTFACWLKPTGAFATGYKVLYTNAAATGIWLGEGKIDFYVAGAKRSDTILTADVWQHIAVVCDGGAITFYLNGTADGTDTGGATFDPTRIGGSGADYYFPGRMADMRYYPTALSAANVALLYANTYSATSPVLKMLGYDAARSVATCAGGQALTFDGSANYLACGNVGNVTAVDFWVRQLATNQELFTFAASTATAVTVVAGELTFGGSLTVSAITVDGVAKTAAAAGALLNDLAWHQVTLALTSIAASDFRIGTDSSAFGNIVVDYFQIGAAHIYPFDDGPFGVPSTGDAIWGWQSQDGSRYLFSQTDATKRPTFTLSAVNGRPGLLFDGTDDVLNMATAPLVGTSGTVMIVAKLSDPTDCTFLASSDTATATEYLRLGTSGTGSDKMQSDQDSTDTNDTIVGDSTIDTEVHCFFFESDAADYFFRLDNDDQSLTASVGADTGDWWDSGVGRDNTTIGAITTSGGTSLFLEGYVLEIAVFAEKLTAGKKSKLWKYAKSRYAIS